MNFKKLFHCPTILLINFFLLFAISECFSQSNYPGDSLYTKGNKFFKNGEFIKAKVNLTAYKVYYILTRKKKVKEEFIKNLEDHIKICEEKNSLLLISEKIGTKKIRVGY